MCKDIAKREGLLVGVSSGAVCKAAEKILQCAENKDKIIVVVLADTGQRYLSVEGLFD
jgi:cysteine synthase A